MKRLLNAAVALVVTLVAYQAYVLGVAPLVEPKLAVREYDPASEEEWKGGRHAVGRYQEMLRSYVPEGHWALTGTPQVYEYGPLILVLDDFRPVDGGRVQITKSLLLAFPTPRQRGAPPPRDAILVEAPERATIQFDESEGGLDLASGAIGRPIAGEFPGELVIRSDMQDPGPEDDLRIVTRDLRFNLSMLWTRSDVDFRLGPHRGHGRMLEVRLLKEPHANASSMPIAGVESLEIREQVRAMIDIRALDPDALPGADAGGRVVRASAPGVRLASAESPIAHAGPLEVTSVGPFRFDFTRFVASFQDDVQATLRRPGSPSDRLTCRELRLHFGDKSGAAQTINPADEPELARSQGRALSGLRPRLVEAIGSPVRIESPSQHAALVGRRLRAWVEDRRLRIEGAPASLAHGLSEAEAPVLEYRAPPAGSPHTVGEFFASGPGWMRITPSPDEPDRVYQARWPAGSNDQPAVSLRRDARDQPVLTMIGRPEFAASGLGKMRADRVTVQMREVPADGKDGPAIEMGGDGGALLVKRIDATGDVDFVGEQVRGDADSFVAMVRTLDDAGAGSWGGEGSGPSLGSPAGFQQPSRTQDAGRYRLSTKTIQLDVGLAGRRAKPLSLVCDGGVELREDPRADGQQPLRIVGAQLRVDGLDRRGAARLTLAGADASRPARAGDHAGLAEIQAQGLRVWVRDLHLDQSAGRAWTEGRGDARVTLRGGGPAAPLGGEATLRWRGGMQFDGRQLTVSDEVYAETTGGWLSCKALAARLSQPVDLRTGKAPRGSTIDVEEVECSGGVTIDYRSTDDAGPRSHERAELSTLAFNRRTGAISGHGPGSIRSVHLAGSGGPLGAAGGGASAGLRFLRVDFRRAIDGNANDRAVRFVGDVQSVYGPVLAWDHHLPLHSPEGVPPDAAELRCEELRVHEDPAASVQRGAAGAAPLGPIEMRALGGVRIDASVGDTGGALVAEAANASYSQAADRFILEGNGQQLARLWARPDASQPFVPASAGRLTHYIGLGRTKIDDLRGAEYQPPASATRPLPPRR